MELGQKKRAEQFNAAHYERKSEEIGEYESKIRKPLEELSFKFNKEDKTHSTADIYKRYDCDQFYVDEDFNVFIRYCGYENVDEDNYQEALEEYVRGKLEVNDIELKNLSDGEWAKYLKNMGIVSGKTCKITLIISFG